MVLSSSETSLMLDYQYLAYRQYRLVQRVLGPLRRALAIAAGIAGGFASGAAALAGAAGGAGADGGSGAGACLII